MDNIGGYKFIVTGFIPCVSKEDGLDQIEYALRNVGCTIRSMSVGNVDAYYPKNDKNVKGESLNE